MPKKRLYTEATKVQFLVEKSLKDKFEAWCQSHETTMTDVLKRFIKDAIKSGNKKYL